MYSRSSTRIWLLNIKKKYNKKRINWQKHILLFKNIQTQGISVLQIYMLLLKFCFSVGKMNGIFMPGTTVLLNYYWTTVALTTCVYNKVIFRGPLTTGNNKYETHLMLWLPLSRLFLYNTFNLAAQKLQTQHPHWSVSSSLNAPVNSCKWKGRCPKCSQAEKWFKSKSQISEVNRRWTSPPWSSREQTVGQGKDLAISHIAFSLVVERLMTFNCILPRLLKSIKHH